MADLMRISGGGEEYSELLEAAGVDTVKGLKQRKAENLAARMEEVDGAKKLVLPTAEREAGHALDRAGEVAGADYLPSGRRAYRSLWPLLSGS
jgi:hypothetical protein